MYANTHGVFEVRTGRTPLALADAAMSHVPCLYFNSPENPGPMRAKDPCYGGFDPSHGEPKDS